MRIDAKLPGGWHVQEPTRSYGLIGIWWDRWNVYTGTTRAITLGLGVWKIQFVKVGK